MNGRKPSSARKRSTILAKLALPDSKSESLAAVLGPGATLVAAT
jgi:hypothetical protein